MDNLALNFAADGGLVVLLLAASAFVFVLGIVSLVSSARDPARRRLAAMGASDASTGRGGFTSKLAAALGPLGRILLPAEGAERTRVERLLYLAEWRSPSAPAAFFGIKVALAASLPLLWFSATPWFPQLSTQRTWFFAACAMFVGLLLPNRILERRVESRQRKLRNGFPDALDLLIICVESGLGLAAAIERVSQELRFSHPELATELSLVNAEMRAGVDRESALRNLVTRTGLSDVRGLVSLLVQTLRFGTSIADTLRVYSEEFRDQRMQRAEENAAKIGTKLIFPLILCEFPAFFVIAVGPAALRIMDVFSK